jgi:hypothetical protein
MATPNQEAVWDPGCVECLSHSSDGTYPVARSINGYDDVDLFATRHTPYRIRDQALVTQHPARC